MQDKITHEPKDERELMDSKEFIAGADKMSLNNQEILKEVELHFKMLEEFSYMYKDIDIESYWFMKVWPTKISACLTDGKNTMAEKNDIFSAKLEQEKELFSKQITQFQ